MTRRTGPDNATRELVMARDPYCLSCGGTWALVVNHRQNRGMGGSRLLDTPDNLTTACTVCNSAYEDDPKWARGYGWKLRRTDPTTVPVYYFNDGWYVLHADGTRSAVEAVA